MCIPFLPKGKLKRSFCLIESYFSCESYDLELSVFFYECYDSSDSSRLKALTEWIILVNFLFFLLVVFLLLKGYLMINKNS